MSNDARPPHVSLLFLARGPATVILVVVAIVIDAVDTMFGGSFAHISDKSRQTSGAAPLVTDSDAASAVAIPLRVRLVVTAVDHIVPAMIERMAGKAVTPCGIFGQASA